jgi:hypothetical protein
MAASEPLIPPRLLFRFAAPCLYRTAPLWSARGAQLGEEHALPALAPLEGRPQFADVRAAWNEQGLAFAVHVAGKRQAPWCRESQMEESDGLHVWLDTRDTHNIHRATRFCHRFAFLPLGGSGHRDTATAGQLLINRAREHPRPAQAHHLAVRSDRRADGYALEAFVAAGALTGFDPAEHGRLGFTYAVHDRELGVQAWSAGVELPFDEDPSLWGTLELVRE